MRHSDHDDKEGLCTGTEMCVCGCTACSVQVRLQLLERIEILERVVGKLLERSADFPRADIPSADIPRADFPRADIPSADIPSADVPSADFPRADAS